MYISLGKEKEKLLRKMAQEKYGGKKGSLTAVIEEALDVLQRDQERKRSLDRAIAHMKKGFIDLRGKKPYEKRADLYERPGLSD